MTIPHPYRLRAYHNPRNADESLVPAGWRMLYADEFPLPDGHRIPCRLFVKGIYDNAPDPHFGANKGRTGSLWCITYIIPVTP
jgi:hypothetical protein